MKQFVTLYKPGLALVGACLALLNGTPSHGQTTAVQMDTLRRAVALAAHRPADADLIALVDMAESYDEALQLVRVALQPTLASPARPPRALANPLVESDWSFEAYVVQIPPAVTDRLKVIRMRRDVKIEAMTDAEFDRYAVAAEAKRRERAAVLANLIGRTWDGRPDLSVAETPDGQIWRRKQPDGYVRNNDPMPPSGTAPATEEMPKGNDDLVAAAAPADNPIDFDLSAVGEPKGAVIGSDSRELRSRHNGFTMSGVTWQPKGAFVSAPDDNGANTDADPVDVKCSGTKISQRLVLSAGHCFFDKGAVISVTNRWIPGADGIERWAHDNADPSPNGYKSNSSRHVPSKWFDHEWSNYDMGIFVLQDNTSSCQLAWHGLRYDPYMLNDRVHLYGYPGAQFKCDASPRPDNKCWASIYGTDGTVTYQGSYRIRYGIDTDNGQSGSGVYKIIDDKRFVVAAHRGPYNSNRNQAAWVNNGKWDWIHDVKGDNPSTACD